MTRTSKTRQIASEIVRATKRGDRIFIDELKSGMLSLKVWDWKRKDYMQAYDKLRDAGCQVELRPCRHTSSDYYVNNQYRYCFYLFSVSNN